MTKPAKARHEAHRIRRRPGHSLGDATPASPNRSQPTPAGPLPRVKLSQQRRPRFLPAAVAQRSDQSGGDVLDHATNASAVVLAVEGLGDLMEALRDRREVRQLLAAVVDELDVLAIELGLERIKVTGDRYYAVCGALRPYLDHAPRAVRFALQAADLVADLSQERQQDMVIRGGVDTGSVSIGLADRSGLVYDAWGPAVSGASELARTAQSGQVAVSAAVKRQRYRHRLDPPGRRVGR